jgi:hypothetical protein
MKGINDPVAEGYAVVAEMFNGLKTVGLKPMDAALIVVTHIAILDYLGQEKS